MYSSNLLYKEQVVFKIVERPAGSGSFKIDGAGRYPIKSFWLKVLRHIGEGGGGAGLAITCLGLDFYLHSSRTSASL